MAGDHFCDMRYIAVFTWPTFSVYVRMMMGVYLCMCVSAAGPGVVGEFVGGSTIWCRSDPKPQAEHDLDYYRLPLYQPGRGAVRV